jgi:hypothetical protein
MGPGTALALALMAAAPVPSLGPGVLVESSVDDGDTVWLATSVARAGGREPGGLVQFDRATGALHAFKGTDAGPCGFAVTGLAVRDGALWVTTDLGVSRLRVALEWDEWAHFAPGPAGEMEETSCGALLAPAAEAALAPGGEAIRARLAEFRPRFWRRYQKRRR